ncbi:MAG: hypothetical protein R3B97_04310 [Dehalococcoidia bacterium]|nr:hypothetical protein [Dehalococcoidia bacterium]MCB9485460.1 hypothetical protein [Thermoflexaceae bacterium]
MRNILRSIHQSEEGHVHSFPGILISAAGVLMLAIGANSDTGWLTITGGIIGALGYLAWDVLRHIGIDYDVYKRLDALEKKQ